MSDTGYDDRLDGDECWNCGGVGRVNDCIDGCCVEQDDPWCEYFYKRCDICNPKKTPIDSTLTPADDCDGG
jgi:hypothetical protein